MAISVNKSSGSKTQKTFKSLNCKICGTKVEKVDYKAEKVTCWKCVSKLSTGQIKITE